MTPYYSCYCIFGKAHHVSCYACMLRIVECMVWLPHEILYQLQQCYSTIDGWYRTMQKYWSTSSMQCIICRQLERSFDLFYYDGLAHQDEVIRLTIGEQWCVGWFKDACMRWSERSSSCYFNICLSNCGHENENRGVAKSLHLEIPTEPHCQTFLEWVCAVTMVQYK